MFVVRFRNNDKKIHNDDVKSYEVQKIVAKRKNRKRHTEYRVK